MVNLDDGKLLVITLPMFIRKEDWVSRLGLNLIEIVKELSIDRCAGTQVFYKCVPKNIYEIVYDFILVEVDIVFNMWYTNTVNV